MTNAAPGPTFTSSTTSFNNFSSVLNVNRCSAFRPVATAGLNGSFSPPLAGRVHKPIDFLQIAEAIERKEMTDLLKGWLKSQNPPFKDEDLDQLATCKKDLFLSILLEQALEYKHGSVIKFIPKTNIEDLKDDLALQNESLGKLILTIKRPGEREFEENPDQMGGFLFLSLQKREANRAAYFTDLDPKRNQALRSWLLKKNWKEDYVNQLETFVTVEEVVFELINYALEEEDYEVIQSIPQVHAEKIISYLNLVMHKQQDELNFIESISGG